MLNSLVFFRSIAASRIIRQKTVKLGILFLIFLPVLSYFVLNPYFSNEFPEESFLIDPLNTFFQLIYGYHPITNELRTNTSLASFPDFIYSLVFNFTDNFFILNVIGIARSFLLLISLYYLIFFFQKSYLLLTSLFYLMIFQTSVLWSIYTTPRIYSILFVINFINLYLYFNKINLTKKIILFITLCIILIPLSSNIANQLSTFLILGIFILTIRFYLKSKFYHSRKMFPIIFLLAILGIFINYLFYFNRRSFSVLSTNLYQGNLSFIPTSSTTLQNFIGSGHWSEFASHENLRYCTWCPYNDNLANLRITLILVAFILSILILVAAKRYIASTFAILVFYVAAYVSSLGAQDIFFVSLLEQFEYLRIFREPWTKFNHFISLYLILIITLASRHTTRKIYFVSSFVYALVVPIFFSVGAFENVNRLFLLYIVFLLVLLFLYAVGIKHSFVLLLALPGLLYLAGSILELRVSYHSSSNVLEFRKSTNLKSAAFKEVDLLSNYLVNQNDNSKICINLINLNSEDDTYNKILIHKLRLTPNFIKPNRKNLKTLYSMDQNLCLKMTNSYDLIILPRKIFKTYDSYLNSFLPSSCNEIIIEEVEYFSLLKCDEFNYDSQVRWIDFKIPLVQEELSGFHAVENWGVWAYGERARISFLQDLKISTVSAIEVQIKATPEILSDEALVIKVLLNDRFADFISIEKSGLKQQTIYIPLNTSIEGNLSSIELEPLLTRNQYFKTISKKYRDKYGRELIFALSQPKVRFFFLQ